MPAEPFIDANLARNLIAQQFPQWKELPIQPVQQSGWDNRSFRLGDQMLIRLPSAAQYALQVEKEHYWLPRLAPSLPLSIPTPLALGQATSEYPWPWSIYNWLPGESASLTGITDLNAFAKELAQFLLALQKIDATKGPSPGIHNFYRGGALANYDEEFRQAMQRLENGMNITPIRSIWESALASQWQLSPVWVHGDISIGNLLVKNGQLSAVIDFGQLVTGDPACDLAIAWTLFKDESRQIFQSTLSLDNDTWLRGCAWALWKALIICAGLPGTNSKEKKNAELIIAEILSDYKMCLR